MQKIEINFGIEILFQNKKSKKNILLLRRLVIVFHLNPDYSFFYKTQINFKHNEKTFLNQFSVDGYYL